MLGMVGTAYYAIAARKGRPGYDRNKGQHVFAGAARVDLDGNPVGEVSATDAEHAAAKLAETLASHEAGKPRPRRVLIRRKASFGFTKMKIARTAASANPLTTIVNVSMRLSPST